MNSVPAYRRPVLVAVDAYLREIVCRLVQKQSLKAIAVSSFEDAQAVISNQNILALVIESDWIFEHRDGNPLIQSIRDKIPILTLINPKTLAKHGWQVYDMAYGSRFQEYCTLPFDLEEFNSRLMAVVANAEK